jgi:DNA-binding transcriptional ArsR family regulator
MSKAEPDKRLKRLINSGICPAENASKYISELKQIANEMVRVEMIGRQSKLFKALADETRLRVVKLLELREMCVCEIMIALGLTQPTASHHLGILEEAGLVKRRKEGKWVFYSLVNLRQTKRLLEPDL